MFSGLLPVCWAASLPASCGSIYKSFAECLVTLGDSMGGGAGGEAGDGAGGDTEKDSSTQDIDAICRSVFAAPVRSFRVYYFTSAQFNNELLRSSSYFYILHYNVYL